MAELNGRQIMLAGLKGEQGPEGPQGPEGAKGATGAQGRSIWPTDKVPTASGDEWVWEFSNLATKGTVLVQAQDYLLATYDGTGIITGDAFFVKRVEVADDLLTRKAYTDKTRSFNLVPGSVDLSGYYTKAETDALLDEKADVPSVGNFPVFLDLSGQADDTLHQLALGVTGSYEAIKQSVRTVAEAKNLYSTGSQVLEAGKAYLVFNSWNGSGTEVDCFEVGADGSTLEWQDDKRWLVPLGSQVRMPNGSVYMVVKNVGPAAATRLIYDAVRPIVGRIPAEVNGDGSSLYVTNNQTGMEYTWKVNALNSDGQASAMFSNCSDSVFYLDFSNCPAPTGKSNRVIFQFREKNMAFPSGYWGSQATECGDFDSPVTLGLSWNSVMSGETKTILNLWQFNNGKPVLPRVLMDEDGKPDCVYLYFPIVAPVWPGTGDIPDDKEIGINMIVAFNGYVPSIAFLPYLRDKSTASGTESAVSLMSVAAAPASISSDAEADEPTPSKEFLAAIGNKRGIFVEKDGKAYDTVSGQFAEDM